MFARVQDRREEATRRALVAFFGDLRGKVLANLRRAHTAAPAVAEIFDPAQHAVEFNRAMIPQWNRSLWAGVDAEARWVETGEPARQSVVTVTDDDASAPPSIFVEPSEQMLALARKFLESRVVGVWSQVGKTTHAMLEAAIEHGIAKGLTFDEMQAEVGKVLTHYKGWQSRRVARTETTGSVNFGMQAERAELGITHKEWISRRDVRTRTLAEGGKFDHLSANGKVVLNDALFEVSGEKLMYPGDSGHGASGGNTINCRCSAVSALDPKKKKPAAQPTPPPEPTDDPDTLLEPHPAPPPTAPKPKKPKPKPAPTAPDAPADAPTGPPPTPKPKRPRKAPTRRKPKPSAPAGDDTSDFPDAPDGLRRVRGLGGSTGAELVEDANGKRYVLKRGASPDHLREEYAAEGAYRAVGARVPRSKLYETDAGPVKLSEFVEGKPLSQLRGSARTNAIAKMEEHYAADALLANWDVAGLDLDNVLVDNAGNPWRIDTGASLRYRAQGTPKGKAWGDWPEEFWSLADMESGSASKMYGATGFERRLQSLEKLSTALGDSGVSQRFYDALPADVRDTVRKRMGNLEDTLRHGRVFLRDNWTESHTSAVMRHRMGLRRAGVFDEVATKMTASGVRFKDKAGRGYDHLRGADGVSVKLNKYLADNGGDRGIYDHWARGQAGSSWSEASASFKSWLSERHPTAAKDAYWVRGKDEPDRYLQNAYRKVGKDKYDATHEAMHAFNYSLMQHVDFSKNDIKNGTVKLIRTESSSVLRDYGLDVVPGAKGKMPRGLAESFSVQREVYVGGDTITIQHVPHTRVFGTYWLGRGRKFANTCFYGDRENEFVCMAGDIEFEIGRSRR